MHSLYLEGHWKGQILRIVDRPLQHSKRHFTCECSCARA